MSDRRFDPKRLFAWKLVKGVVYEYFVARPALRRANVDEELWFHPGCGLHARAGHRRQHDDFQHAEYAVLEATTRHRRPGTYRADREDVERARVRVGVLRRLPGLPGPELDLRRDRR